MNKTIAVEDNLSPVKSFLAARGCRIVDVEEAKSKQADVIVLSGCDQNLMGMQDMIANAPVINASGKMPQEVWEDIQRY